MSLEPKEAREPCCSKLKLFLLSLSFVYFAKAFQGSYMKSSVTQIERRFDIPSSMIGVIDGSFEMGNLLVIAFVSYFGAKLHRPRLIGAGCLIMAAGSFFTALPHFFQGQYQYETTISHSLSMNETKSILPCLTNQSSAGPDDTHSAESKAACEKEMGSSMWIYVFLGNMLRGIGETPVMPLGVSYLDDFSREENTAFYLALIQTVAMMGPMLGFLLGSVCAKLYVDIGAVDLDSVAIDHKDSRWVGAWWLGFLITGCVMLLAGIPFWFLPKSLPKQGKKQTKKEPPAELNHFIPEERKTCSDDKPPPVSMAELAKDFLPALKRLFSNSVYLLIMGVTLIQVNGFIGMITFKPKYMEQVYGKSPSKVIFMIGIMNLPAVAMGIMTGGLVMKKFKLSVLGAARLSITSSFFSFCLLIAQYFLHCDNAHVPGLTVSYQGTPEVSYMQESLLSQCNAACSCSLKHWDPVCAYNGMTYTSPCLAGCQTSSGSGRDMVFHNCTCVGETLVPVMNMSAVLGVCPRKDDCDTMFKFYMAVTVLGAYMSACGATPGSIVLLRSISPDLKSLALGMQMLVVRTLGGIPPPIYFGALIDRTCLKWGSKRCGGRGACRFYDSHSFRVTFLGLVYGLYALAYLLWGGLYFRLVRRQKKLVMLNQAKAIAVEGNVLNNGCGLDAGKSNEDQERESTI